MQAQLGGEKLFAICNNAGIGFGNSIPDTLNTNLYGPKRVTEAFLPLLDPKVGRVVNVGSGGGGGAGQVHGRGGHGWGAGGTWGGTVLGC